MVLHSDSATAMAIFQASRGRDQFIQACNKEIWLVCAVHAITLSFAHTPREQLTDTADTLSCFHTGGVYEERVHQLREQGVCIVAIPKLFELTFFRFTLQIM